MSRLYIVCLLWAFISLNVIDASASNPPLSNDSCKFMLCSEKIQEPKRFFGLAAYYNNVRKYSLTDLGVDKIPSLETGASDDKIIGVYIGRYNAAVEYLADGLSANDSSTLVYIPKSQLKDKTRSLPDLRYFHLWLPIDLLARAIESTFHFISTQVGGSWGSAILVLALVIKLALLPVSMLGRKIQTQVSDIHIGLEPRLKEIKKYFDGEEAHKMIISAHRDFGVSPFYQLKPMALTFVQVPILIAVFNVLGGYEPLYGEPFLWIENLAYPDKILDFGSELKWFGDGVYLLPILMTLVSIFASSIHRLRGSGGGSLIRERVKLYLVALIFLALFYPFPSAMVLFWTAANVLQMMQDQLLYRLKY